MTYFGKGVPGGSPSDRNSRDAEIGAIRFAGWLGGFIAAYLGSRNVFILAQKDSISVPLVFMVLWMAGLFIAARAPSAQKAWQWLLAVSACFCFLFPVSGLIAAAGFAATQGNNGNALRAAGSRYPIPFLAAAGLILGLACIAVAVRIGRKKQEPYLAADNDGT